jgi:hypothetical protein
MYVIKLELGTMNMGYIEVLSKHVGAKLGTWGTCCKISGNLMGIMKIQQPPPSPKEKELGPLGACWPISLVANNLYAYFCSLPFLA